MACSHFVGFWAASEPQEAFGNAVTGAAVPQVGCFYHIIHQRCFILFTKAVEVYFSGVKTEKEGNLEL